MREITIPISDDVIRSLHVGDPVELTGIMITGRDAVHKWMSETFIKKTRQPQGDDLQVYEEIRKNHDPAARDSTSECLPRQPSPLLLASSTSITAVRCR